MDFGDVIYRCASDSTLKALDAVYHSAVRLIAGDVHTMLHPVWYCDMYLFGKLQLYITLYITAMLDWSSEPYQTWSKEPGHTKIHNYNENYPQMS